MSYARISESGSFTGNGSSQTITLGWQPAIVWIGAGKASGGATSTRGWSVKFINMPGSATFYLRAAGVAYEASGGVTITSTGFSVGSQAIHNANGQTIYWWAVRDGPHVEYGTYTGQQATGSTTPQVITTAQPPSKGHLLVLRASTSAGAIASRIGEMIAGLAFFWANGDLNAYTGWVNGFQFTPTSFSVSNDTPLFFNGNTETYYWVLIQNNDGATDASGTSFGSTRYYHHEIRTGLTAGANETIDYGLPTKQLIYATSGGPIYSMNWDPMPSGAAFFARNASAEKYITTTYPIRTSTGYQTNTVNPGTSTRSVFWHY